MRKAGLFFGMIFLFSLIALAGCTRARIHRLTDREYEPKPPEAPIDMFVGQLNRPYESVAIADSDTYALEEQNQEELSQEASEQNAKLKERMLNDLQRKARLLGGDAVHNLRLLPVKIRGMVPDSRVPLPGAMRQGSRYKHFLRGEVVRYVQDAEEGVGAELQESEDAEVSEDEAPTSEELSPASSETIRTPSVADEETEEGETPED